MLPTIWIVNCHMSWFAFGCVFWDKIGRVLNVKRETLHLFKNTCITNAGLRTLSLLPVIRWTTNKSVTAFGDMLPEMLTPASHKQLIYDEQDRPNFGSMTHCVFLFNTLSVLCLIQFIFLRVMVFENLSPFKITQNHHL